MNILKKYLNNKLVDTAKEGKRKLVLSPNDLKFLTLVQKNY